MNTNPRLSPTNEHRSLKRSLGSDFVFFAVIGCGGVGLVDLSTLAIGVHPWKKRVSAVRRAPLALLVVALARCEPAPEASPLPRLVVDAPAFDFRATAAGRADRARLRRRNDGGAPLTIIDLRTASDCTATLDGPRDLPAGARHALGCAARPTRRPVRSAAR